MNHVSSGIIRHYVVAFVCLHFCLTRYQSAQFIRRALHYASGSCKFLHQSAKPWKSAFTQPLHHGQDVTLGHFKAEYGSPHIAAQKQDDQLERTFSSYVRIQDVVLKTYLRQWTIGRSGERGSGISVLPARYDDDDDDDDERWFEFRIFFLLDWLT